MFAYRFSIFCLFLLSLLSSFPSLHALRPKSFASFSSQEEADDYLVIHYNLGAQFYNDKQWKSAANEFERVIYFCPYSNTAAEAAFFLGICYYHMKEYDFANREFTSYLKASDHPIYFEETIEYKLLIAEHFRSGRKRRPFEMRYLPKWICAKDLALTIYDEIVAALPNHEFTIQALYAKANLLREMKEYRESIETYQALIRRFPKNEIASIAYFEIAETYVQQSRRECQNPDLLALAELNLRKFTLDFPRDEKIPLVEGKFQRMKEIFARGLSSLGLFYERRGYPNAAVIYFQSCIEEFPDTQVAEFCRSRLICLGVPCEAECEECTAAPSEEKTTEERLPEENPIEDATQCSDPSSETLEGI